MATDAIISFAVERIGTLLIEEAKFLYGVSDKVKQLQRELQRLRSFLKDAEARQHESERVRNWIAEIREAAYDAEDILETYVLEVESRRGGGIKGTIKRFACLPDEAVTLHKIGTVISEITARLSEIAASLQAYGIQEAMTGEDSDSWRARIREQRQSFPHVMDRDLVGLESSIEKLASDLVAEEQRFQVLSICGMGGLGKTTLARQLYQHDKVRKRFDHFAWAYISQQCQRRDIWEGLLVSLSPESSSDRIVKMRDQELVAELHDVLSKKKCLVVLDDIWSVDAWDSLKCAFPYETQSRIVLTSRNKEVGLHSDREGLLHEPQCLNDEESWELLQKIVFPRCNINADFNVEEGMEELGKQMMKNCGGLPLAIRVLGGLLAKKCTLDRWQKMYDNIKSYVTKGIGQQQTHSSVYNVLSLSYDELASHLKSCFLHLAHFPEDYEIPVDKLMKFWTAEGLASSLKYDGEQTRRMEDVAESFLDELIERSMVLVGSTDSASSRVLTCRLHDLMRDICLLKANEECFMRVIDPEVQDTNGDPSSFSSSSIHRRIAVHLFRAKGERVFRQKLIKNHHLRSLLYFNRVVNYITKENSTWKLLEPNFKDFKVLRVLDLEGADPRGGKLPRDIGKLIHLRFLSLLDAEITEFPSSLGNLRLLETLDLRVYEAYVPDVIWKMQRLRHLYLPERCDGKSKLQLGNLKELQTLVNFQHGVCDVRDLFSLVKLETLTIHRTSKTRALVDIMPINLVMVLKNLRSLSLGGNREFGVTENSLDPPPAPVDVRQLFSGFTYLSELVLYLRITKLPDSGHFPRGITHVTFGTCKLEEDPMPVLETLPKLRFLDMRWDAFTGQEMVCSGNGFPQLLFLHLFVLHNLEEWKLGEGGMPNLQSLDIGACRKLKALPEALKGIASLKELEIYGMPESFKDKLVPGGEDFYKIQQVPSVVFQHCGNEW